MSVSGTSNDELSLGELCESATTPTKPKKKAGAVRSKASVRASLACVPCRSKHMKCDSTLPSCVRCQLGEKTCYYAKSRRGIRDPKKRSMISDSMSVLDFEPPNVLPPPDFAVFDIPIKIIRELPGGWSLERRAAVPSASPASFVFDLYYTYFHSSHPWVLPKEHLLHQIHVSSTPFTFLAVTMAYIGSIFSTAVSSDDIREKAFTMACGPLPMTPWSVQALLIISIAALGEGKADICGGWIDRATQMALDIGMQHKGFADSESNPIVAECYRRTYWGLYYHNCIRSSRESATTFPLYSVLATTELPCEEWRYQSGDIPMPTSLDQYHNRDHLADVSCSSWAYLIDLAQVVGEFVLPLNGFADTIPPETIDRVDSRLVSWLLNLPKWKQEVVDPEGVVDMVLFHAIGLAHTMRIKIQLPLSELQARSDIRVMLVNGPLIKPKERPHDAPTTPWIRSSTALQAALSLVGLFNFGLPPARLSPTGILALDRASRVLLDAAVYGSGHSPALRDKLDILIGILKIVSETWPVAKVMTTEVADAIQTYIPKPSKALNVPDMQDPTWEAFINSIMLTNMMEADPCFFPQARAAEDFNKWPVSLPL